MKKLLMLIVAGVALLAMNVPAAQAGTIRNSCNQYFQSAGGKAVEVCVSIQQIDNGPVVWTRITYNKITGYSLPYAVRTSDLILWSTNGGGQCEGRYPGCSGGGDWIGVAINPTDGQHDDTDHYTNSEHKCVLHGEAIYYIYYTQNHYNNNQPDDQNLGHNTGDYDITPWCVS